MTTLRLYVVRHAHAGGRSSWGSPDVERPLSGKGRRQATGIAALLAEADIARLVSSPAVRCVQTLEPLGARLGLPVDADERLAEGAGGEHALALADELAAELTRDLARQDGPGRRAVALCSHGDVIPELLRCLQAHCATRIVEPLVWPKGSTWMVTWSDGCWATARYAPPPPG